MVKVLKMMKVQKSEMYINKLEIKNKSRTFNSTQVGSKFLLINRYFKSHFGEVLFKTGERGGFLVWQIKGILLICRKIDTGPIKWPHLFLAAVFLRLFSDCCLGFL